MAETPSVIELTAERDDLRARLAESEEVLRAIRNGEVDAMVVTGGRGAQVYTLSGADRLSRQLIEAISDGAAALSADGLILYCNACLAKMLGRPLDQVSGTLLRDYLPLADQKALDAVLTQTRMEPSRLEINLKTTEDRLVPVYLSVSRLQGEEAEMIFCLVLTDLTEQKSHEQIVAAERLARLILEQAAEVIIVCDELGLVIRASQAAQRFCDGNPLTRPFAEVFHLRTDASDPFHLAPVLRGKTMENVDVTLDRQGQEFDLILNAGPLLTGPQIIGCVITLTDITERKRSQRDLKDTNVQLKDALDSLKSAQESIVRQERLAALGEMASGIAHDLNNALSPVVGYADLLLSSPEHLNNREFLLKRLGIIHMAAMDAAEIVRRLREFNRPRASAEELTDVNINDIVTESISLTSPHWKGEAQPSGIRIDVLTNLAAVSLVTGNPTELREALANLLINAFYAMPKGGTVTVASSQEDRTIIVKVTDTGTGMSAEVLARCLEPFFTTKGDKGSGLGLAMVYGIATRHGGTLAIASAPGKGTTVSIKLPAVSATRNTAGSATRAPSKFDRKIRILLVDDEDMIREVVSEFLQGDGHTVTTADSGAAAIGKMRESSFDLAITDRSMPQMNGDELAAAIKGLSPNIPVIMMTGFGDIMNSAEEKPPHVDRVVGKPITQAELREVIAQVMAPGSGTR